MKQTYNLIGWAMFETTVKTADRNCTSVTFYIIATKNRSCLTSHKPACSQVGLWKMKAGQTANDKLETSYHDLKHRSQASGNPLNGQMLSGSPV